MESAARYHLLQNEPDDEVNTNQPAQNIPNEQPEQPTEERLQQAPVVFQIPQPLPPAVEEDLLKSSVEFPPEYHIATDLPSYEDVERAKINEERRKELSQHISTSRILKHQEEADLLATESALLGTDFLFFTSFFVSFLFNWMGFLLVLCFCHTVAGRYGALAGFGLSLSKWMLIVKHSTNLMNHENDWLWWLVMAFGILICVRASLQYIRAKREWRHLSSNAQERLFYFY